MPVDSAALTVEMTDGRVLREHVRDGRGTPGRPMTDPELDAKATELIGFGAPHVDAPALIAAVRGLEDEPDAARTVRLTVPK